MWTQEIMSIIARELTLLGAQGPGWVGCVGTCDAGMTAMGSEQVPKPSLGCNPISLVCAYRTSVGLTSSSPFCATAALAASPLTLPPATCTVG
jgi:hypothetical protein